MSHSLTKLAIPLAAAALGALLPPLPTVWARIVAGWDAAAVAYLAIVWPVIATNTPEHTRHRAAAEDPGRTAATVVPILGSLVSLVAAVLVFSHAANGASPQPTLQWLALGAVVSAWAVTHSVYTLRYARLYYRQGRGRGLEFPGGEPPDDLDFAYFAFTVGMAFQVSDVAVSSREMRRAVFFHAVTSFVYNTVILAVTLNLLLNVLG
jgi:uncharacterized membrane protein